MVSLLYLIWNSCFLGKPTCIFVSPNSKIYLSNHAQSNMRLWLNFYIYVNIFRCDSSYSSLVPGGFCLPAHFATVTKSSMTKLQQYLGRRAPRAAIEDDQGCWVPCQRCSRSRGLSSDSRTLSSSAQSLISLFSSPWFLCYLAHNSGPVMYIKYGSLVSMNHKSLTGDQ